MRLWNLEDQSVEASIIVGATKLFSALLIFSIFAIENKSRKTSLKQKQESVSESHV